MLDDKTEYGFKVKALKHEFDMGRLPDTDFINSFISSVYNRLDAGLSLSDKQKSIIDRLFEEY